MNTAVSSDAGVISAARWFWWIAGLSLVNTVLFYSGSDTSFVIGLAMTTLSSVFFADIKVLALLLVALTVGFYFVMGQQAQQGKAWAFYL